MKLGSTFLLIEAAVLGLAATVAYVGVLPVVAIAIFALATAPSIESFLFVLQLLCGAYALIQFWRLSIFTVRSQLFAFDLFFWLGLASALVAAYFVFRMGRPLGFVITVIPPALATAHFCFLQVGYRNRHT